MFRASALVSVLVIAATPAFSSGNGTTPDWLIFHPSADVRSGAWIAHGSKTRAVVEPGRVRFIGSGGADISMELVGSIGTRQFAAKDEAGVFTRIGGASRTVSLRAWQTIEYPNIYPGIHLKYSGAGGSLKSEYYVEAGVSPSAIRMRYGAARPSLRDGDLVLRGPAGVLREHAPEVFQQRGGQRIHVDAQYRIHDDGTVGFDLGPYDTSTPLVIDPQMDFSTVWGGALSDAVTGVAIGPDGSIYATGWTASTDLLTTASLKPAAGGSLDGFVVKISPAGTLAYATYIGGSGYEKSNGIAVDTTGAVYLTGMTDSFDFPVASAFQTHVAGEHDVFILKLDPTGRTLVYSTLVGGSSNDQGNAIQIDSSGAAYVAGETDSADFPTTTGAYQRTSGGGTDAFVVKLQPSGALAYSTYLGGYGTDRALALAARTGEIYVTGATDSPNFPIQSPLQAVIRGRDAFVAKLNASGTGLVYSTFLGGGDGASSSGDAGLGVAVDSAGEAYVTGVTSSYDFPTPGAIQPGFGGGTSDAFLAKLNAAGTALLFSTYLGGTAIDRGESIVLDTSGNAYVAGTTWSSDFPIVSAVQVARSGPVDAFILSVDPLGHGIRFSTYWGGSDAEASLSIAAQQTSVVIGGQTQSVDFPLNKALKARDAGATGFLTRFAVGDITSSTISVSVGTTPSGLGITVDGTNLTAPQTFSWTSGSSHTVCTASPQTGGAQSRYVWTNWSDGGAICHSVAPQAGITYTAAFATQYQLMTSANPLAGGTVMPASGGYYDAGATVALTAVANPWYAFSTWIGDAAGTSISTSVVMNGPKSAIAGFTAGGGTDRPPSVLSVSPASGSGSASNFAMVYADPDGYADLAWVQLVMNSGLSAANGCYVHYDRLYNAAFLLNDDATAWIGPAYIGYFGGLQNSQCHVNAGGSYISGSGNNLGVSFALTFKPAFAGPRNLYMQTQDMAGLQASWQQVGSWTVLTNGNQPPSLIAVSPASGSGSLQTFSFTVSDPNGFADIPWVQAIFNAALDAHSGCYIHVDRAANAVFLLNDALTRWDGPVILGTEDGVRNSQCVVVGTGSSVTQSGSNVTVNLRMAFPAAFSGARHVYAQSQDVAGLATGWQSLGTWTVTAGGNQPPDAISVTPSSGNGLTRTFSFVYSDPNGYADLPWAQVNVTQSNLDPRNACFMHYDRATNSLFLMNDAATGWVGPLSLGSGAAVQNNQCSVAGSGSSATGSGTTLTLRLALTFKTAFKGARTVNMKTQDAAGLPSGWRALGSWTVQ